MPATRELRRRIRSVRSTRQITKAMELVSASKMRRAGEVAVSGRPYAQRLLEVLTDIAAGHPDSLSHPFFTPPTSTRSVAVVIASNRGLAGTYNASILKQALTFARQQREMGHHPSFITAGSKVERGLVASGEEIVQSYLFPDTHPNLGHIQALANSLMQGFLSGQWGEITLIYTHFYSLIRYEVQETTLLPVPNLTSGPARQFSYEPGDIAVLERLVPRLIEVELFQALLESLASEHSARRIAMQNATDNASDMIDHLTLTYNGLRQGAITQEIAEITSGAAALTQ